MTADPRRNPYRPGVGTRPPYLAGRSLSLRRFGAVLDAAPELPANVRLTGLRGVGKTVLLAEFEEVAEQHDWASAGLELQPAHNRDDSLVDALLRTLKAARENLSRIERLRSAVGNAARNAGTLGISWGDFTLTYEAGQERHEGFTHALFQTVETAIGQGYRGLVLLLDEAQVLRDENRATGQHPLSLLISSLATLQKAQVPVGLVLCGLPTLTGNLLRARSYTERMFRGEEIGSLEPNEAHDAFVRPLEGTSITAAGGLVDAAVEEVDGYPYFVQLWGAELWDAARAAGTENFTIELLDAARPEIYRRLDLDFYEPRVSTLTPAEQDVLLATAECPYPPLVVADLNGSVSKTPANINVLLGRLVESGVLYRIRKGEYEYTAPRFRDYLLRRTHAG